MIEKIAVLTDSSSSIYNFSESFDNLFMIDLPCFIGEDIYTDFKSNKDDVFYQALRETNLVPKTSQPSIGETLEKFEYIKSLGYSDIIYLPISKELSGTYMNGYASKDLISDINIEIVDTKTTASILGAMAFEAARMAKENKSVRDILKRILALRERSAVFVTVNDLTSLVKNGRLSNAKSIIANIFRIKPIIKLTEEGKLISVAQVRTYKGAMRGILERVAANFNPKTGILHIYYTGDEKDLKYMKDIVLKRYPDAKIEVHFIPSTIVAHLGLSSIALGYIHY